MSQLIVYSGPREVPQEVPPLLPRPREERLPNIYPVSFTGQYLYQVNKFFLSNPAHDECLQGPHEVARGISTLGIAFIAPFGLIYHVIKAAEYAFEQIGSSEEKCEQLDTYIWQHVSAALFDGLVVGALAALALLVSLAVVGIVMDLPFLLFPVFGVVLLLLPDDENPNDCWKRCIYPWDLNAFLIFLSNQRVHGEPSTKQVYFVNFLYDQLVRQGMAIDHPLTMHEIDRFLIYIQEGSVGMSSETIRISPLIPQDVYGALHKLKSEFDIYNALLSLQRLPPQHFERIKALVNQEKIIEELLLAKINGIPFDGYEGEDGGMVVMNADRTDMLVRQAWQEILQEVVRRLPPIDPNAVEYRNDSAVPALTYEEID
jgi:hypothetical protein